MSLTKADHNAFSNAIESGDASTAEAMLQQYPELANHPDWTPAPIHCAVLSNRPEIVELLLKHGADIELPDPDRQTTPLRYAIMYCKTEVIPLLLSRGANSNAIVEGGQTAIELAQDAATGAYEMYDDLPTREDYANVVELLQQLGLE